MSKILLIRHFPATLTETEKEEILKHFGAQCVWRSDKNKHNVFASFNSEKEAQASMASLHQMEIGGKRLVVEYGNEKIPVSQSKPENISESIASRHAKTFLKHLNAWNSSVDFLQPPPPYINYKYPKCNPTILMNIMHTITQHVPLYTQVLHLLNKMSLKPPFSEVSEETQNFFYSYFQMYLTPRPARPSEDTIAVEKSSTESEISSNEDDTSRNANVVVPKLMKRKSNLPKTRKRVGALLAAPKIKKSKKAAIDPGEVFDGTTLQEPKKINVKVAQDTLTKTLPESGEHEDVGEMGKIDNSTQNSAATKDNQEAVESPRDDSVTYKELLDNKISFNDLKILPVFKNYHPGIPSARLYVKNLSKTVTVQDLTRIYNRYMQNVDFQEAQAFSVRLMQEGRMKGQAFVTFPFITLAERALNETNGYILKDKPMVVQYAKSK